MFRLKPILKLSTFKEIRLVRDDCWNKVKGGEVSLCYFTGESDMKALDLTNVDSVQSKSIAYINFRLHTEQVGLFFIDSKYQNRTLGKQILLKTIYEMHQNNVPAVWAITTPDHPFWSNVFNKKFKYSSKPHPSVSGDGYSCSILDCKV